MSERLTQGISISIVGLLVFGLVMFGYLINQTQDSAIRSEKAIVQQDKNIEQINGTLNKFVDRWDERIKVSNEVNNSTQRYQTRLAENLTEVVNRLETAELQRGNVTTNILGNLTSHRLVTNHTNDIAEALANQTLTNQQLILELENQALDLQNKTNHILNTTGALTGPEYEKLADQRVKSIVNQTVANLTADHKRIFEKLNITSDN